jgi:hypothetical protein
LAASLTVRASYPSTRSFPNESFQEWLKQEYPQKAIKVLEHPVPDKTLTIAFDIRSFLLEGRRVVLMDSGGVQESGQVWKHLGALEDSWADLDGFSFALNRGKVAVGWR